MLRRTVRGTSTIETTTEIAGPLIEGGYDCDLKACYRVLLLISVVSVIMKARLATTDKVPVVAKARFATKQGFVAVSLCS